MFSRKLPSFQTCPSSTTATPSTTTVYHSPAEQIHFSMAEHAVNELSKKGGAAELARFLVRLEGCPLIILLRKVPTPTKSPFEVQTFSSFCTYE